MVGVLYQLEFTLLMGSLKMNIMITFSLSVVLCWLLKLTMEKSKLFIIPAAMGLAAVCFLTDVLPLLLQGTGYGIDYGFLGVLLPVALYAFREKKQQLIAAGLILAKLALETNWPVQWASLLALPLLALYSAERGKRKLKWLFYIYYPAHLTVLWILLFWLRK